jgi:SAM-dependent methyltransferase
LKPDLPLVEFYTSKTRVFKFRGKEIHFALSHGLFSSAGIDRGTELLLKALSRIWDEDEAAGRPPPRHILDAGCGAGIIGICAALAASPPLQVRAQDRDELARLFTEYNALANGVSPESLSAHTEPLLASPPGLRWDLILSNIPAKAGQPVLEDFLRRSTFLLNPGGKVMLVAVHTLADFFRTQIDQAGGEMLREEHSAEHTVFVYTCPNTEGAVPQTGPVRAGPGFLESNPFYLRQKLDYEFEGIPLHLDTIHGAPGFDCPGGAAEAAAKLVLKLKKHTPPIPAPPMLIHEPEQGWFPAWLLAFLERECYGDHSGGTLPASDIVLSGRNILSMEAARSNIKKASSHPEVFIVPAVELSPLGLGGNSPAMAERFGFIAVFPESVPRTDRREALWEGIAAFLAPGGTAIVSLPSSEADRFDRKKIPGLSRLGELKRKGFRALAYRKDRKEF